MFVIVIFNFNTVLLLFSTRLLRLQILRNVIVVNVKKHVYLLERQPKTQWLSDLFHSLVVQFSCNLFILLM